jgi:anthranilate synthase component II
MKLLILDNYDSFVFNLAQAFRSLGAQTHVVRSDAWTLAQVRAFGADALVISPGPGHPENAAQFGVCARVVCELGETVPLLGVCLGHQGIVHALGGRVVRAAQVMHGKCSAILHDGQGIMAGLPQGFAAMRYHSLVADPGQLPACLCVRAWTADGTIMAIEHRSAPIHGVQFHPESIGTPLGRRVLGNFLAAARAFRTVGDTT